jgi:hypothetical protein
MRELKLVRGEGPTRGLGSGDSACLADGLLATAHASACEHRAVSKEGRIICQKITEGDPEVSPNICRDCPFKQIDCAHLRFSLRLDRPSPLVVRFNGRTEIWDDGPPQLALERAACSERVIPINGPRVCASCPLRKPLGLSMAAAKALRPAVAAGKVVSFPAREVAAAVG